MENIENKSKNKMKIYEDQTQIQQFVEPEWMKILKRLIENNPKLNEKLIYGLKP